MRFRGPLIGLTVFMTVALTLGWLVYATLLREVSGSTTAYSAIFTD
ncbi:mammalian cell entry protein, partial [Mycobacteroides abscessus subsp. massiliense]|nr:mammalian cell entry protein [Mycobacteroides abscessus subsp. massiliense]